MKNGNLERAGQHVCLAYQYWLNVVRNPDDIESMRAGDAQWILAEGALRECGINNAPCDEATDERERLESDPAFDPSVDLPNLADAPIDFKPLERSYRLSLAEKAVKFIVYGAIAVFIAGAVYLDGYGAGREAGAYPTAAQLEQYYQSHKGE